MRLFWTHAVQSLAGQLQQLLHLTIDNPTEQRLAGVLATESRDFQQFLAATLVGARGQMLTPVLRETVHEGNTRMASLRSRIDTLLGNEPALLQERTVHRQALRAVTEGSLWVLATSAAILLVLVLPSNATPAEGCINHSNRLPPPWRASGMP